ncbi:MAG TPA: hypothetical protein VFI11_02810 [Anaerolineales bacterium]|nr:hypothetical protein [Anaerolineales bacterium]
MTTTSDTSAQGEDLSPQRERLEKLLQITSRAYDLSLAFGPEDRLGDRSIVIGLGDEAKNAGYPFLKGLALHLLGHYLSDLREAHDRARELERAGRPGLVRMWHALEDARLENRMLERWPGMHKSFAARLPPNLGGSLLGKGPVARQVDMGLYLAGRGITGARLSPPVRQALDDVSAEIRKGAAGQDARASLEAVERIYPRLARLLAGASARGGKMHSAGEVEQLGEAETSGVRPSGAEGPPQIDIQDGLVAVKPLGLRRELPEWYRPGSAPWFEQGLGAKEIHPSARRSDRQTIVAVPRGESPEYQALWREVQGEAGRLIAHLVRRLEEETYLRYAGRYRSGKLEMNRLWKQRRGDYRLFQRREHGGRSEAAFTILVDESASMQGEDKIRTATKAAILLGEALSRLRVPFEIIGFSTADFEARRAMELGLTPAHAYRTTRCTALEHRIYKSFDESYEFVRTRLAGIRPRCNNWDEEHLLFAFRRLQPRREAVKVILVVSDGQPNGDADHLIRTVAAVENQGCRVVGIGIGADFVERIYPKALVVSDFRQMAEPLVDLLAAEMGKARSFTPSARPVADGAGARPW